MLLRANDEDRAITLRRFLRHVIIAAAKFNDSKHAWQRVNHQLNRIKEVSVCQGSEEEVEREIQQLKQNLQDYIQKEKKIKGIPHTHFSAYQELLDKVNALDNRIEKYLHYCGQRQQKMDTVENRFKQRIQSHQERLSQVEQQIQRIEEEYARLAKTEGYDKKTLHALKKRLQDYKRKFLLVKKRVAEEFP